jgi:hypothetical protein
MTKYIVILFVLLNTALFAQQQQQATVAKESATSPKVRYAAPINEEDIYMGRTNEFKAKFKTSTLPADFPKYDKSYGLRYYNELVDNYCAEHLNLLNDRMRQKLEQSRGIKTQ